MKVAIDGSVWVADAHGGRVAVFNPDGSHRQDIACRCRWSPACASPATTCTISISSPARAAGRTTIAAASSGRAPTWPACPCRRPGSRLDGERLRPGSPRRACATCRSRRWSTASSRRLNDAGVPVARIFVGMNTLHPLVLARSLIWDRATGPAHALRVPACRDRRSRSCGKALSSAMLRAGITSSGSTSRLPPAVAGEAPVFAELRGLGMTDWLGRPLSVRRADAEHRQSARGRGCRPALARLFARDRSRPAASRAEMAVLREVLPVFALAVKAITMRAVCQGLLESYLGNDPASARAGRHGAARRGAERRGRAALRRPARLHRARRRLARRPN